MSFSRHIRSFLFFALGGALGAAAGAGGMLVAFPYLFPPPAVNETVDAMAAQALLLESRFREDAPGQDAAHWGRGGIKAYRGKDGNVLLELQADFEVGPGPNFWLYLNTTADIGSEGDFYKDGGRIKVTKLKSFSGSQVYPVSAADYRQARALTIWCESFGQYIASANLAE